MDIDIHQFEKELLMTSKLHVSLDVKNVEESVKFYSVFFGAEPTKVKPGYAKFDLENPAVNFTMQEFPHCCLQGLSHMGLRVDSTEQVVAFKSRLNAAGLKTEDEMNTTCCYAVQDKIWVTDPTGYRWEVYVFKGDTENETVNCPQCGHEEQQSAAGSGCCMPEAVAMVTGGCGCEKN
jgi:catechol 2,3-dioxygenase-like lactoylglutathione lyase family enzyme